MMGEKFMVKNAVIPFQASPSFWDDSHRVDMQPLHHFSNTPKPHTHPLCTLTYDQLLVPHPPKRTYSQLTTHHNPSPQANRAGRGRGNNKTIQKESKLDPLFLISTSKGSLWKRNPKQENLTQRRK